MEGDELKDEEEGCRRRTNQMISTYKEFDKLCG